MNVFCGVLVAAMCSAADTSPPQDAASRLGGGVSEKKSACRAARLTMHAARSALSRVSAIGRGQQEAFGKADQNVRFNAFDWMIFLKDGARKKELF
ncbi:hypothetical protein AB4Z10_10150 [Bosea sp. RAF48]|uniref:hypothetical protein n=1 Tax=Bosea sp. RAF48 TaxID=3237480 RepID=UPI003F8E3418